MKKLLSLSILLVGCNAGEPCNIPDEEVIKYVTADLGIYRATPMSFTPKSPIVELCKAVENDPIGCTTAYKALVLETLTGQQRVNIIAHEQKHVQQFQIWAERRWTGPPTITEPEAYAYGDKIAAQLCNN